MRWFPWQRRARTAVTNSSVAAVQPPARRGFFFLGGRRHVADAPYMLPKDDQEINRLDFQHYMLRYALRGNYIAPLRNPLSILDVGCGTGRWPMELALQFPQANVVGLDLVAPPADAQGSVNRPDNYVFTQGNVLEGLPFADNSFDFVHMRLLLAAIPATQWQPVVNEIVRVTQPGGWVELVEPALSLNPGVAYDQLMRWWVDFGARRGIDLSNGGQISSLLATAHLHQITTREVDLPVGAPGGRLGNMVATDILAVGKAFGPGVVAQGITTAADYDQMMQRTQQEFSLPRHPTVWPFHYACGQR